MDPHRHECVLILICVLLSVLLPATLCSQTAGDFRTISNGQWDNPVLWEYFTGTTWIAASAYPTGSDGAITIRTGDTIILNTAVSLDQLVIEPGGQLTVPPGQTLALLNGSGLDLDVFGTLLVQGSWSISSFSSWKVESGGYYIHNNTNPVTGALDAAVLDPASTFEYRDAGSPSISGRTYGNLKLYTTSQREVSNNSGTGDFVVNGTLSVGSGLTWNLTSGFTGRLVTNGDIIIDGTWRLGRNDTIQAGKTFQVNGSIRDTLNPITISGGGNFVLAPNAVIRCQHINGLDGMLNIQGILSLNTGAVYEFAGTEPQVTGLRMPPAIQYLTVAAGGGLNLSQSVVVSKILRLKSGVVHISAPGLTLSSGALIRRESGSLDGAPIFGTTVDVAYIGTAGVVTGQELPIDPSKLQTLTINNSGGVTLSSPVTVNQQLNLDIGTLNINSAPLTMKDSTIIDRSNGILSASPAFQGRISVWYAGPSPVTTGYEIPGLSGTLQNFTVNNDSGVTLGSDISVHGLLLLNHGSLNGSTFTIGLMGSWTPFEVSGGTFIPGSGKVQYFGVSATIITPVTYNRLELHNPIIYSAGGSFAAADMTVGAGAIFIPAGTVTGTGTLQVDGTLNVDAATFDNNYAGFVTTVLNPGSLVKYLGSGLQQIKGLSYHHLLLYNPSGAVLDGSATIHGYCTLANGLLDIGSNTLTLYNRIGGNVSNLRGGSSSSITFTGTGESMVIPASITDLNNLTVDNPFGVTLTGNLAVHGTANILNGKLRTTSAYSLSLEQSASLSESGGGSIVYGHCSASRIISSVLTERFGGVGIEITPASTPFPGLTNVLRTTGSDLCGGPGGCSIKRYYTIDAQVQTGLDLSMVVYYDDSGDELGGRDENKLYLFRSPTGSVPWIDAGFSSRNTISNTVQLNGVTDLSTWTLSDSINRLARPASWKSDIIAVAGSEASAISSLVNDPAPLASGSGVQVWQFDVRDGGSVSPDIDSLPTLLTSVTLQKGPGNSVADWPAAIRAIDLFAGTTHLASGVVDSASVTFSGFAVVAPDNGIRRLTVRLSLNSPLGERVRDHQRFEFLLDESLVHGGSLTSSSQFAAFPAVHSSSARDSIQVIASQLWFSEEPPASYPSRVSFSTELRGVDIHMNADSDYAGSVTLGVLSGSGILSAPSGLTKSAVAGIAGWSDLKYSIVESGVRLLASDGLLNPDTSVAVEFTPYVSDSSDYLTNGGETVLISSLINDPPPLTWSEGIQVWSVMIRDGGASQNDEDALPTILTGLRIIPSDSNTVPDWSAVIASADLFLDTNFCAHAAIMADTIVFTGCNVIVPDDSARTISLRISLKQNLPGGSDGQRFGFRILPLAVHAAGNSASSLIAHDALPASSAPDRNSIDVTAVKLLFDGIIPNTIFYTDFQVTVRATDNNENTDTHYADTVTLSIASGPGALHGTTSVKCGNGIGGTADLMVDVPGIYSLKAAAEGLLPAVSNYFTAEGGTTTIWHVTLPRWNMLSVPLTVFDYRVTALFPTAISKAFAYSNVYYRPDTLQNGVGYWLKFSGPDSLAISGESRSTDSIRVMKGWNMIGSISQSVPVASIRESSPGLIASQFFTYDGKYVRVDTIETMTGSWMKASVDGTLYLSGFKGSQQLHKPARIPPPNVISFITPDGSEQSLYFGVKMPGSSEENGFDLPPVPPEGVFDVRFAGDNSAIYLQPAGEKARRYSIAIQSDQYPIVIHWDIRETVKEPFVLHSTGNGTEIIQTLAGKGTLRINEVQAANLYLEALRTDSRPDSYSLLQNYPNPFNPETQIRFTVPGFSHVRITVYDLLGRSIRMLLNDWKQAGYHTIAWDGKDDGQIPVPTGVYFVRMTSDDFSSVRKVMLMK